MAIPLLKDVPLAPPADLGPYRRKDYEALPNEPRCELIYGRFYVSPSPSVLHQIVVMQLIEELHRVARPVGALALIAPLDVYLADHSIVQPDILYISKSRRRIAQEWIEGAPDLLIEVLSPGMYRKDRNEKLQLYAECDVREYWIVDPHDRWIEFLRNDSGQFVVVLPKGGVYRSQALPEISLDILRFWREIGEQLTRVQLEV
jgi:Uma2 family endonuclease